MPFEEDLYKTLLDESKLYREKVSTIWLQKFSMLGAVIAFIATRSDSKFVDPDHQHLIAAAILSIPIVAVLLDVKLGEFGLHANVIDHFIMKNFTEPPLLGDWERTKWGLGTDPEDRRLIRWRSLMTLAVTVGPTCLIAILSILAIAPFIGGFTNWCLRISTAIFCALYVAAGLISVRMVLFRR